MFDIIVSHPGFAELTDDARAQITFLALDWLLGEDDVGEWLGRIEQAARPEADWHPLSSLRSAVDQLVKVGVPESWATLEGQAPDGSRVVMTTRRPLKRTGHPLFDLHVTIELRFSDQTAEGLPGPRAVEQLQVFEDHLAELCAANGVLVAYATNAGLRSYDVYTDHASDLAERLTSWTSDAWPGSSLRTELDPAWEAVDAFL